MIIYIIIGFSIVVLLLVLFMFLILKKTVDTVSGQTKTYFVDKLQVYDDLINKKEEKLNEINKELENKKAMLESDDSTVNSNNYAFDSNVIDLMNKASYKQSDLLELQKKMDNDFQINYGKIVKKFIDEIELDKDYDISTNIRKKLDSKLIYELECSPNLIEAMPKYFNKEEIELYNRFKLETNLEDINSFVNYLDELISVTSPYIEVYVSSSRYNFDSLSKYVRTIVSDDIYKGIKIVFKNKVYDFSLNERNV